MIKVFKTICYNTLKEEETENLQFVRLGEQNFVLWLVQDIHKRRIQSVIIEGGAHTLQFFIQADLWDEARIFESTTLFGNGISAPIVKGQIVDQQEIYGDSLKIYRNR